VNIDIEGVGCRLKGGKLILRDAKTSVTMLRIYLVSPLEIGYRSIERGTLFDQFWIQKYSIAYLIDCTEFGQTPARMDGKQEISR
jgi:hypothetical protein